MTLSGWFWIFVAPAREVLILPAEEAFTKRMFALDENNDCTPAADDCGIVNRIGWPEEPELCGASTTFVI